jgi:hypothetical protein
VEPAALGRVFGRDRSQLLVSTETFIEDYRDRSEEYSSKHPAEAAGSTLAPRLRSEALAEDYSIGDVAQRDATFLTLPL